jgi:hypothetical protein
MEPDELTRLRNEVAALRAEVEALRSTAPRLHVAPTADRSTRRQLFRRAGTLTAGAVAGGIGIHAAQVAAASSANGEAITAGNENFATETTELRYPGFPSSPSAPRSHVLAVQDGVWNTPRVPNATLEEETGSRAVIGAYAGAVAMHGGFFQTNHPFRGAAGVRALGLGSRAYGISVTGERAAIRIERRPLSSPPPTRVDAHNEGEIVVDDNSDLWYCVAGGSPGSWRKVSGPSTAGQFHAITPARVYDSRVPTPEPGALLGGQSRTVNIRNARDLSTGAPTGVIVPAGSSAIAYNLTITDTVGGGFLAVNPGGDAVVRASAINWSQTGISLANGLVAKLDDQGQVTVICGGGGSTHVLLDVLGYYR